MLGGSGRAFWRATVIGTALAQPPRGRRVTARRAFRYGRPRYCWLFAKTATGSTVCFCELRSGGDGGPVCPVMALPAD